MTRRKHSQPPLLLLDTFSVKDLTRWDVLREKILRYHWDLYSALAYERRKIADQIHLALLEAASDPYEFGQIVANAGIGGILYPSKFTKKKCLAIFPQNFDSEDFVVIDGATPVGAVSRLDAKTWASVKTTL